MNLKELLKKLSATPEALSAEEIKFLRSKEAELNDEQKEELDGIEGEEEKELDVDDVKKLVAQSVKDALGARADDISKGLIDGLFAGVAEQREKILAGQKIEKDERKDDMTRKFMKALLSGDKAGAKALTTSTSGESPDDAAAGLLIPDELRAEVLRIAETQFGLARREMLYLPFSGPGNSRKIPALGTSVSVFWAGEEAKKKSTQPKFNIVEQTLKKLAAIVPFTEEILEDSAINLTQLIATLFAEAVSKEEDIQFFAGVGTPWTGILNNGNVNVSYQAVAGVANVDADDLLDMQDEIPTGALNGAKYYLNRRTLNQIRKLKATDGHYIWQGPKDGTPGTIWNFPYELTDALPAPSEVETGDNYIIFGNLRMSCVFGDKGGQLRIKLLEEATINDTDDATGINLAEQDMVALRIVERVGYVLALPEAIVVLNSATSESPES